MTCMPPYLAALHRLCSYENLDATKVFDGGLALAADNTLSLIRITHRFIPNARKSPELATAATGEPHAGLRAA